MSEPIIQPAPVYTPDSTPPAPTVIPLTEEQRRNLRQITDLQKMIRRLNVTCEPIQQSILIEQEFFNPQIRILVRFHQLLSLAFAIKALVKGVYEESYMEIENPPDSLRAELDRAFATVDTVANTYIESMRDMLNHIQGADSSPRTILSSMTSTNQ
jgi:hypothetical protein